MAEPIEIRKMRRVTLEKLSTGLYRVVSIERIVKGANLVVLVTRWDDTQATPFQLWKNDFITKHQAASLQYDVTNEVVGLKKEDEKLINDYYGGNSHRADALHNADGTRRIPGVR